MKIGWISPTVGVFGSVREVVEVSNRLVKNEHEVTIFHPTGTSVKWLDYHGKVDVVERIPDYDLDILISIIGWNGELFRFFEEVEVRNKAVVLMGFDPSVKMADILSGKRKTSHTDLKNLRHCLNNYLVFADSSWQLRWVEENVPNVSLGVPIGGINLDMFQAKNISNSNRIVLHSGDPRPRKGTDTVNKAFDLSSRFLSKKGNRLNIDSYWGKGYTQEQLVGKYQESTIFVDGHRRAGWCNPVAEAMACYNAVVCTDIGAVSDFAIHNETAFIVEVGDFDDMANKIVYLLSDEKEVARLSDNAYKHIQNFSYDIIVPKFEEFLKDYL